MVALRSCTKSPLKSGFTLIEMSIVLVIIGLIIGGVLVGRDLLSAATIRAQISQIEKYNAAVNTFRGKYGYLPGDIPDPVASNYGFTARAQSAGEGDGNGIIEAVQCGGYPTTGYPSNGVRQGTGETTMVWVDLSTAGLISGGFNTASAYNNMNSNTSDATGSSIGLYFPQAKIGQGNYVYAWSGGPATGNSLNYWGISLVPSILDCADGGEISFVGWSNPTQNDGLTITQAYTMDSKIDDGLPTTGRVQAMGLLYGNWPGYSGQGGGMQCFTGNQYNLQNGNNLACALSFQFQ